LSPQQITFQLHSEGIRDIYLVSENPDAYSASDIAPGTKTAHRDELDAVMKTLRETPGCSAIVFVQTCAAEKRRRRKRGILEDPARRVLINPASTSRAATRIIPASKVFAPRSSPSMGVNCASAFRWTQARSAICRSRHRAPHSTNPITSRWAASAAPGC
jgi:hypothetical protein